MIALALLAAVFLALTALFAHATCFPRAGAIRPSRWALFRRLDDRDSDFDHGNGERDHLRAEPGAIGNRLPAARLIRRPRALVLSAALAIALRPGIAFGWVSAHRVQREYYLPQS